MPPPEKVLVLTNAGLEEKLATQYDWLTTYYKCPKSLCNDGRSGDRTIEAFDRWHIFASNKASRR